MVSDIGTIDRTGNEPTSFTATIRNEAVSDRLANGTTVVDKLNTEWSEKGWTWNRTAATHEDGRKIYHFTPTPKGRRLLPSGRRCSVFPPLLDLMDLCREAMRLSQDVPVTV